MFSNVSQVTKSVIIYTLIFSAIAAVVGFFVVPENWYVGFNQVDDVYQTVITAPWVYMIGLVTGLVISVFKTVIIEKGIDSFLEMGDKSRAASAMRAAYVGRFVMTAVLFAAVAILLGIGGLVGLGGATVANTLGGAITRMMKPVLKGKEEEK